MPYVQDRLSQIRHQEINPSIPRVRQKAHHQGSGTAQPPGGTVAGGCETFRQEYGIGGLHGGGGPGLASR